MAHSNGYISAPVSFADVNATIGASHTDLGTMCRDTLINKWAKYKPVEKNLIDTTGQLDGNLNWLSSATWWKGNNGNCGITYNSYTSVASVRTAIVDGAVVWGYTQVSGGSNSPFRLIDFNQYSHNAPSPTTGIGASDAQLKAGAELTVMVATSVDDDLSIKLNHIGAFANYYFTLGVFDSSGTLKFLHSASKPVGQYTPGETIEIVVPYNNGTYGYQGKLTENVTYKGFVFISSVQYTCTASAQSGTYIPLPKDGSSAGLGSTDIRCLQSSQYATVDATAVGRIVSWTVNLYGGANPSAVTLQLIYANGQVVSGQSKTIDFSAHSTAIQGGYTRSNFSLNESFTCPDANIDNYRLQFIYSSINVVAIIGHDINPDI